MTDYRLDRPKVDALKGRTAGGNPEFKRTPAYEDGHDAKRTKNTLYTHFSGLSGRECKHMYPHTICFCNHRYDQHKIDFEELPKERPILLPCQAAKCKCVNYHYVILTCCQPIRCHCKHTAAEHNEHGTFVCRIDGCTTCTGYKTSYNCGCGAPMMDHKTIVETAEEKETRRHRLAV